MEKKSSDKKKVVNKHISVKKPLGINDKYKALYKNRSFAFRYYWEGIGEEFEEPFYDIKLLKKDYEECQYDSKNE